MNVVFDVVSHSRGLGVRGLRRKEDFTTKARSARRSMIVYTFLRVLRVFVVKKPFRFTTRKMQTVSVFQCFQSCWPSDVRDYPLR
jgi:hypothetical protein